MEVRTTVTVNVLPEGQAVLTSYPQAAEPSRADTPPEPAVLVEPQTAVLSPGAAAWIPA